LVAVWLRLRTKKGVKTEILKPVEQLSVKDPKAGVLRIAGLRRADSA